MCGFPCWKSLTIRKTGQHPRIMAKFATSAVRIAKQMKEDKIVFERGSREHQNRRMVDEVHGWEAFTHYDTWFAQTANGRQMTKHLGCKRLNVV